VPKPRGYFRIDLPDKAYQPWSDEGAIAGEIPTYARMAKRLTDGEVRWYDLRYKDQRATVHFTWTPLQGNLMQLIEDAHVFKNTHEVKAARIGTERIERDNARVYGRMFNVDGDVASPMVIYLTDSTENFLYGALYFDVRPNADSLAPVTARIREDMRRFAETLEWR
jgi:gliding motility-associated lipoprotein GldD